MVMGFLDKVKTAATDATKKARESLDNIKLEDITSNLNIYEKYFSESDLLDKVKKFGKAMGATVLYPVLLLFNLFKSNEIDLKEKAMIAGTLGYVILPVDLIPDVLAGMGYSDDAMALMAAITALASCISENIQQQSKEQLHNALGEFDEQSLDAVTKIIKGANDYINK